MTWPRLPSLRPNRVLTSILLVIAAAISPAWAASTLAPGLWIGDIRINQVGSLSEASAAPTPTMDSLSLRLLLLSGPGGRMWLLRAANLVTLTNRTTLQLAPFIVTDTGLPSLLTTVGPLAMNQDRPMLRRISSITYDWDSPAGSPEGSEWQVAAPGLPTTNESTNSLTFTLILSANAATNPFKHAFHPSHREGISLQRRVTLTFPARAGPTDGSAPVVATYAEAIVGLQRTNTPIHLRGLASFQRVSAAPFFGTTP